MSKKYIIDLSKLLNALDFNDCDFYKNLSDEQKKSLSMWTTMRWASSVEGGSSMYNVIAVNEMVNKNFSLLSDHEELQWRLIASCGQGRKEKHIFISPPKGKRVDKIWSFVSDKFPEFNNKEIELFIELNGVEELKNIAKDIGMPDDEIKEIFKKK